MAQLSWSASFVAVYKNVKIFRFRFRYRYRYQGID